MKPHLLERICCPKCRGDLEAVPFAPAPEGLRDGLLLCRACSLRFPVAHGVPVMLLFRTGFHREFERRFAAQLEAHAAWAWPSQPPGPGEATVQGTFTEEWDPIAESDDPLTFTYTTEDLVALNRRVWLKWLPDSPEPVRSALVVGCGGGKEILALARVLPEAELVGIDINLSVLRSGPKLLEEPKLHVVVCSLFHPPFRDASFDLVYSQGVIHHNVSTREAFGSIARFVRRGGFLFVWVYGLDDHLVKKGFTGFLARVSRWVETPLRPFISFLPAPLRSLAFLLLGFLLHPLVLLRVRHRESWRMKNTIHALRDWLSPRYAHEHSFNEVIEWYEREGYTVVDVQSPAAYRDLFQKRLWGVGLTGRRAG